MAFAEKMSPNNEEDELLETDPPKNGTVETPIDKEHGGGKLVEKFVDGQLSEIIRYDADDTIIEFIDQKRLGQLVDEYLNILQMKGVDEDMAIKLSNQLFASFLRDVPASVKNQIIKTLNYQSFMSKDI